MTYLALPSDMEQLKPTQIVTHTPLAKLNEMGYNQYLPTFIDCTKMAFGCRRSELLGPSCTSTDPYTPRMSVMDTVIINDNKITTI